MAPWSSPLDRALWSWQTLLLSLCAEEDCKHRLVLARIFLNVRDLNFILNPIELMEYCRGCAIELHGVFYGFFHGILYGIVRPAWPSPAQPGPALRSAKIFALRLVAPRSASMGALGSQIFLLFLLFLLGLPAAGLQAGLVSVSRAGSYST